MKQANEMVTIRRATVADVDALVELRLALESEIGYITGSHALADMRQATRQYFVEALPSDGIFIWVAEAAGSLVATSGLTFFQKPPSTRNLSGKEAYILNMYTVPEWRGRGIGSRLVDATLAYVKTTTAHRIWLYAAPDGKPLYERAGFVPKVRLNSEMELWW